jgi:integrase
MSELLPYGCNTKAAKRARLLETANDADEDELRALGEAGSTTRSKASRVSLFTSWLAARGIALPVRPERVQLFAAQLTMWEYRHISDYTSSVIQWLCEPPETGEAPRLAEGPGLLRNLADVERSIIRTISNGEPTKAPPIRVGAAWDRLSEKDTCLAALWSLTGLRMDSMAAIKDVDVKITATSIHILVIQDKVKNQQGRQQAIYCNCTEAHGTRFCPLHCATPITSRWFPIGKATCGKIAKALGGRAHSFRRACALALRSHMADRKFRSAAIAQHMGWENSAAMWNEYTFDFTALWADGSHAFVPVVGLFPALATTDGKPHVFKQRTEKVLVKRSFPISANQVLAKGKLSADSICKTVSRWEVLQDESASSSSSSSSTVSSAVTAWAGKLRF